MLTSLLTPEAKERRQTSTQHTLVLFSSARSLATEQPPAPIAAEQPNARLAAVPLSLDAVPARSHPLSSVACMRMTGLCASRPHRSGQARQGGRGGRHDTVDGAAWRHHGAHQRDAAEANDRKRQRNAQGTQNHSQLTYGHNRQIAHPAGGVRQCNSAAALISASIRPACCTVCTEEARGQ